MNVLDLKYQQNPDLFVTDTMKIMADDEHNIAGFLSVCVTQIRYQFKIPDYADKLEKAMAIYGFTPRFFSEEEWNNKGKI